MDKDTQILEYLQSMDKQLQSINNRLGNVESELKIVNEKLDFLNETVGKVRMETDKNTYDIKKLKEALNPS